MRAFSAVVLAGGAGRRMGGVLKPLLEVGGASMLHRVLAVLSEADEIVVVGPAELARHLPRGVGLTQEDPPGSGPVAGIAAGMQWLTAGMGGKWGERSAGAGGGAAGEGSDAASGRARGELAGADEHGRAGLTELAEGEGDSRGEGLVAVVGGDLPFLSTDALALLRQNTRDVALYVDDEGRRQPMVAVWSAPALVGALSRVPNSMFALIGNAGHVAEVTWPGTGMPPWQDCDTPQELERARRWLS